MRRVEKLAMRISMDGGFFFISTRSSLDLLGIRKYFPKFIFEKLEKKDHTANRKTTDFWLTFINNPVTYVRYKYGRYIISTQTKRVTY